MTNARLYLHRLKRLAGMAQTAVRNPRRTVPWLRARSTYLQRRLATARARWVPDQRRPLDDFRGFESWCLVVLDACRYDVFAEVAASLFEGSLLAAQSVGHDTFQWVSRAWPHGYGARYISGATPIHAGERDGGDVELDALYEGSQRPGDVLDIREVWRESWDRSLGTVPPAAVTEAALEEYDEYDRLVAHYFQPHAPFIGEEQLLGHHGTEDAHHDRGEPVDAPIWEAVKAGAIPDERLRRAYRENLRAALPAVCRLVAELDRPVTITADHGEALGEYGIYGHPRTPHPKIRRVPWLLVEGLSDAGERVASTYRGTSEGDTASDASVEERLEQLGYLSGRTGGENA